MQDSAHQFANARGARISLIPSLGTNAMHDLCRGGPNGARRRRGAPAAQFLGGLYKTVNRKTGSSSERALQGERRQLDGDDEPGLVVAERQAPVVLLRHGIHECEPEAIAGLRPRPIEPREAL